MDNNNQFSDRVIELAKNPSLNPRGLEIPPCPPVWECEGCPESWVFQMVRGFDEAAVKVSKAFPPGSSISLDPNIQRLVVLNKEKFHSLTDILYKGYWAKYREEDPERWKKETKYDPFV